MSHANPTSPLQSLWSNRNFNLFWVSQTFDAVGDACAKIALPLLVLELTGSIVQMGVVTAIMGIGSLVACVSSGLYIDSLERLRLMIACDIGRASLYPLIPLGLYLTGHQTWPLYVIAGLTAYLNSLFLITHTAAIPSLVPNEHLTEANARLQATFGLSYVIGPMLAGFVASRLGTQQSVGVIALLYTLSMLLMLMVRTASRLEAPRQQSGSSWNDLLGGVRFILGHPVLKWVALFFALFAFFSEATVDLTIFRLERELHQSKEAIGLVFGISSLGAVLAGVFAQKLRRRWGFGACFLGSLAVQALAMAGIGLTTRLWTLIPMTLLFTLGLMLRNINTMTYRQQVTPDYLLGRVSAAFWALIAALGPIGVVTATWLAASHGVSRVLVGMGILGIVVAGVGAATAARER